jgi:hypothetical protein
MPRTASALLAVLFLVAATLGAGAAENLTFTEMYVKGVLGFSFSPRLKSLAGRSVQVTGFMAPPLRAEGPFFVLTRAPVSLCPFCNTDADWPMDILVIYLRAEETFIQRNRPLLVTGRLELGSYTDPDTGFVSQVRLVDAAYREM